MDGVFDMPSLVTSKCGCSVYTDPDSGVICSLTKCPHHTQMLKDQPTGKDYYRSIGLLDAKGEVREEHYTAELLDGIGRIPPGTGRAIEVGCGVSPYVRAIQAAGYEYIGVEMDRWAAEETGRRYGVEVRNETFDSRHYADGSLSLIVAVHVVEHMVHAPMALESVAKLLVPGGHLVIVVPDDTDLWNPDHRWFFNTESLYATLTRAGLLVPVMTVRKRIERENFIYALAKNPEWNRGR